MPVATYKGAWAVLHTFACSGFHVAREKTPNFTC